MDPQNSWCSFKILEEEHFKQNENVCALRLCVLAYCKNFTIITEIMKKTQARKDTFTDIYS